MRTTDAVQPPGLVGSETDPENRSTLSKSPSDSAQRSYQNPHLQTDCQLGALSQATRPPGRRPPGCSPGKSPGESLWRPVRPWTQETARWPGGPRSEHCRGHPASLLGPLPGAGSAASLASAAARCSVGGGAGRASSSGRWQSGQWRSISQGGLEAPCRGLSLDLACSSPLPSG